MRHMQYGFPEAVLDSGAEHTIKVDVQNLFRPEKLIMVGHMAEIRGHFNIKRSRLPLLNRDDVVSYSRIYKCRRGRIVWFRRGRTTVEYSGPGKNFTRTYLPSSVEYIHTDPLEYIILRQMFCGTEAQMPAIGGASALFFGVGVLGNGMRAASTESSVSLVLQNKGDIQVRVRAAIFGVGR